MDARWLRLFREYSVIGEESNDFRGGSVAWLMSKLYHEFRRMDHTSALMIEGLTLEIIAEASHRFAASKNCTARWLEHARDLLHEQFSDNITLADLAELVGVHPVYLASSFRKKYHCTVGEYQQRLRPALPIKLISPGRSSALRARLPRSTDARSRELRTVTNTSTVELLRSFS